MINILVDEAYAFDFLSILAVKIHKSPSKENEQNYRNAESYIQKQILEKYLVHIYEVLSSEEYNNLYNINKKLYELVDEAKKDTVKASEVDAYVYKRYLAKKALQNAFFSTTLAEQKIGYENATRN